MFSDWMNPAADSMLPVLLDWAAKGMIVLTGAGVATLLMRKASASARHLVWALAMASVLLLPVLSAVLPGWHVLPRWVLMPQEKASPTMPAAEVMEPMPPAPAEPLSQPMPRIETLASSPSAAPVPAPPAPPQPLKLPAWLLLGWIAGAGMTLCPVLLSYLMLRRLRRSADRIDSDTWPMLLHQLKEQLNLRRPVLLLGSSKPAMPMTWGIFRPVLLLPHDSRQWTAQRRRIVLVHELAHVKRRDCLWQLLGQLACGLYWFNPLVWLALKQMQAERERACDDLVLGGGIKGSQYAEQLLEIASNLQAHRMAGYSAIAMARPSKLEGRLLAILDAQRNRRALTMPRLVLIATLCAIPVVVVAMLCKPTTSAVAAAKIYILNSSGTGGSTAPQRSSFLATQVEIIRSAPVLNRVIEAERIRRLKTFFSAKEDPVAILHETLNVELERKTDLIAISFGSPYGDEALAIVRAVVDAYTRYSQEADQGQSQQTLTVLQQMHDEEEKIISQLQQEKRDFQKTNPDVGPVEPASSGAMQKLLLINTRLNDAHLALVEAVATVGTVEAIVKARAQQLRDLLSMRDEAMALATKGNKKAAELLRLTSDLDLHQQWREQVADRISQIELSVARRGTIQVLMVEAPHLVAGGQADATLIYPPTQPAATQPATQPARVLQFPRNRSLGILRVHQTGTDLEDDDKWIPLSEARGQISVPAGALLRLDVSQEATKDLSPLAQLRPDDLHALSLFMTGAPPQVMEPIGKLTGLKDLSLRKTAVDDASLRHLAGLLQLESLSLSETPITDQGLVQLRPLARLKGLDLAVTRSDR